MVLKEGYIEHHRAKVLIAEIEARGPNDQFHDAKVKVQSEQVEHRAQEEEKLAGKLRLRNTIGPSRFRSPCATSKATAAANLVYPVYRENGLSLRARPRRRNMVVHREARGRPP